MSIAALGEPAVAAREHQDGEVVGAPLDDGVLGPVNSDSMAVAPATPWPR